MRHDLTFESQLSTRKPARALIFIMEIYLGRVVITRNISTAAHLFFHHTVRAHITVIKCCLPKTRKKRNKMMTAPLREKS